jgi:integrase
MRTATYIRSVKRGALNIVIRKYSDGRYGFDIKPDNYCRHKVRLTDLDAAVEKAESLLGMGHAGKADLMSINPDELSEFLRWKAAQRPTITVPALVKHFMEGKRVLEAKGELSYAHVKDLDGTLKEFAKAFTGRIDQLDRAPVEKWLTDQNIGPRSFNNRRAHIVALIRHARAHRWIDAELTTVEDIPKRKAATKKETYTPAELERILRVVESDWLPAVVLGAFCGIRPEEIAPDVKSAKPALRWENFLWSKAKIDVPAVVAKDGRRRFVPICDAAMAWLKPWRNARGRTVPRLRLFNRTKKWAAKCNLTHWKDDGLRHSYASYRLAIIQNIPQLTLEMGNSVRVVHDHYLDHKHEDEAREWFAITPEKLGIKMPANIIQFEAA